MNYIQDIADYFEKVKSTIDKISKEDLNALLNLLNKARDEGRFVFVCGNGGSASTTAHEIQVCVSQRQRTLDDGLRQRLQL